MLHAWFNIIYVVLQNICKIVIITLLKLRRNRAGNCCCMWFNHIRGEGPSRKQVECICAIFITNYSISNKLIALVGLGFCFFYKGLWCSASTPRNAVSCFLSSDHSWTENCITDWSPSLGSFGHSLPLCSKLPCLVRFVWPRLKLPSVVMLFQSCSE